jgi:hypothetical protein
MYIILYHCISPDWNWVSVSSQGATIPDGWACINIKILISYLSYRSTEPIITEFGAMKEALYSLLY